jgi:hypothetical protein
VSILRCLSTRRLLALLAVVAAAGAGVGVIAVTALGGGGETPPAESLSQAIHDAAAAPAPEGITARVVFTNNLFPSGSLLGNVTSALISGAHGRLWATNDGHGRIELQSDAGDTQLVWSPSLVSVYDASSDTVYRFTRPAAAVAPQDKGAIPTVAEITSVLEKLSDRASFSAALPDNVAGRPAYSVTVSPKQNGGLVGGTELAWDATQGVPLSIGITAKGSAQPVLELRVSDISFGQVSSGAVDLSPPASAKVVDLSPPARAGAGGHEEPVSGAAAVRAAVPFSLVAPEAVGGRALTSARLVGEGALLVYGSGLDALVVHERAAKGGSAGALPLGPLPTVSVGRVRATELSTPLGTVLTFEDRGVSFVVAGSVAAPEAEAAAGAFAA